MYIQHSIDYGGNSTVQKEQGKTGNVVTNRKHCFIGKESRTQLTRIASQTLLNFKSVAAGTFKLRRVTAALLVTIIVPGMEEMVVIPNRDSVIAKISTSQLTVSQ